MKIHPCVLQDIGPMGLLPKKCRPSERVTMTYSNFFLHYGHICIAIQMDQTTDRRTDIPFQLLHTLLDTLSQQPSSDSMETYSIVKASAENVAFSIHLQEDVGWIKALPT